MAKIVDDLLLTCSSDVAEKIFSTLQRRLKLGSIVHGPDELRFNGLNIIQNEDLTVHIDAGGKQHALGAYPNT